MARQTEERRQKEEQERIAKQRREEENRKRETTILKTTGTINGHEWVDLGLSVKWAACNVGASTYLDYGNYYAWGEVSTKSKYLISNSTTLGETFGDITGDSQHDAARANWGGTWRLPTKKEMEELKQDCRWVWISVDGRYGYKVIGPNGNTIFIPANGSRDKSSLQHAGENAYYWSSTPGEKYITRETCITDINSAYGFYFNSYLGSIGTSMYSRYRGYGVRPVSE